MKAYVFPGQGAQFVGMGKDLYDNDATAKEMFEKANEILGFRITDLMFEGTDEDLRQTKVTQPAIFLHSVILAKTLGDDFKPSMVAGHSLGEFSALVAAGALSFEDGVRLVSARAQAMQKACELKPSTMAAVIALPDEKVEEICESVPGVVVCANYNCPGQSRWRFPLSLHGARPRRTRRGNRKYRVPHSDCSRLSECRRKTPHRPCGNQGQPRGSADRSCPLDPERTEHDCRRCR